jgi:threonine/homoserine/homoserine lactone efflux protein
MASQHLNWVDGMTRNIKLFLAGLAISFFGSMAPGTLNMTTLQVSAFDSVGAALWFAFGAVLIEMLYAALAVTMLHRIKIPLTWKTSAEWIFTFGLLAYGGYVVYSEFFQESTPTIEKANFTGSAFFFGMSLSFINPFQVPFWMFWGTLLKQRNILDQNTSSVFIYTVSSGSGAFLLLASYAILGGENRMWINADHLEFMVFYGSVFLLLGFIQAWRNTVGNRNRSRVEQAD